jgi:hypothetical protein
MKGMSFQNGVEFRITIEGESWTPGSTIQGRIESKPSAKGMVILAEGIDKKVKAKSPDAFVVLNEITLTQAPFDWHFELPMDSRISDKSLHSLRSWRKHGKTWPTSLEHFTHPNFY